MSFAHARPAWLAGVAMATAIACGQSSPSGAADPSAAPITTIDASGYFGTPPAKTWTKPLPIIANAIFATPDGGFIVTASTKNKTTGADIAAAQKYDAEGNKQLDFDEVNFPFPAAPAVSFARDSYVFAYTEQGGVARVIVLFGPDGKTAWRKDNVPYRITALTSVADGFVVGGDDGDPNVSQLPVVGKLDMLGNDVSRAEFPSVTLPDNAKESAIRLGFAGDVAALVPLKDGGVGVAGTVSNSRLTSCGDNACGSGNTDALVGRVGADGVIVQSARIGGEHFQVNTTVRYAAACADGGFLVGGSVGRWNLPSDGPDPVTEVDEKLLVMRAAASGEVTWGRRYITPGSADVGYMNTLVSDGGNGAVIHAFVGGTNVLMQIDGSGGPVWYRTLGGVSHDTRVATSIARLKDGGIVLLSYDAASPLVARVTKLVSGGDARSDGA